MKKLFFIYNPTAGKGQIKIYLQDILETFARAGFETTVCPTLEAGDACAAAARNCGKYDIIVCSGGDGTLNEVINGIVRQDIVQPMGYIPAGSTNDFAAGLGIPLDMKEAAKAAVSGNSYRCDIGSFNGQYFSYVAGFGTMTAVSYETKQGLKNVLGHAAYIIEAMKRLKEIRNFALRVEHDGEVIEASFVLGLICNASSIGGFTGLTGDNVKMNDGLFEVVLVESPVFSMDFQNIAEEMLLGESPMHKYIHIFKTAQLSIHALEKVPWTLDGEYGGEPEYIEIKNIAGAIDINICGDTL